MDAAVRAFVSEARVARLATVGEDGRPHVVPVSFALAGDRLYIALDEKPKRVPVERLRRVRNIRANPRVQVLVDRYDEDWSRLEFAQLSGIASLLQPREGEHAEALRMLRAKYPQYGAMRLEERPVIVVEVERVSAWRAGTSPPRSPSPPGGEEDGRSVP